MNEARNYFTRHHDVIPTGQKAYYAKIEKNQQASEKALSSGEYKSFRGWSREDSDKTFDIILELNEPSQQQIIKRVVEPLRKLANDHHITAIYPGYGDLPPHVVLQPGIFTNLTPAQTSAIRDWLLSDNLHLGQISDILKDLTFHHGSLVIGPNSYICASDFNEEQGVAFRARRTIEIIMTHELNNLRKVSKLLNRLPVEGNLAPPYSYYDIFHSSVMRLTEKADSANALAFAQEAYATVGIDLGKNPVPVTVKNLYRGIATDYHQQTPQLILP